VVTTLWPLGNTSTTTRLESVVRDAAWYIHGIRLWRCASPARELFSSAFETRGGSEGSNHQRIVHPLFHSVPFEANVPARFTLPTTAETIPR